MTGHYFVRSRVLQIYRLCLPLLSLLLITFFTGFAAINYSPRTCAVLARGDTTVALQALDHRLSQEERDYRSLLDRGWLYLESDKKDKAEKDFRRVLSSDSDSLRISAYCGLAWCSFVPGKRRSNSLDYVRQALSVDSRSAEALYTKATLMLGGDVTTDDARVSKSSLLKLLEADIAYGNAYRLWHDVVLDKTVDEIRQVDGYLAAYLESHPDKAGWWLDLAWDRYLVDGPEVALDELVRLTAKNPEFNHPDRLLLGARCKLETGDTLAFQELYWQAVDLAGQTGHFGRLTAEMAAIFSSDDDKQYRLAMATGSVEKFMHYFWAKVDPDKIDPLNRRLVEHYIRLAYAQRNYRQEQPNNRFNTNEDSNRLLGFQDFFYEFHSEETTFSPGKNLMLDHRGLLYVRYGPPERIEKENLNSNVKYSAHGDRVYDKLPNPMESWWYDGVPFLFEKSPMTGEYAFRPLATGGTLGYVNASYDGSASGSTVWGDMQKAMAGQRFTAQDIHESENYYVAQFASPDNDGLMLEVYQDEVMPPGDFPTEAVIAAYDTLWYQRDSRKSQLMRIPGEQDNRWVAVHAIPMPPGKSSYAITLKAGNESWNGRGMLNLPAFDSGYLELSAVVLGLDPPEGSPYHERMGVKFIPRPSFRFQRGEKIRVYHEVNNLVAGASDERSYQEYVDVLRYKGEKSFLGRITGELVGMLTFGEQRTGAAIRLNFDRNYPPGKGPLAESFLIDSSELEPGQYRLLIEAMDKANQFWDNEAVMFEIVD